MCFSLRALLRDCVPHAMRTHLCAATFAAVAAECGRFRRPCRAALEPTDGTVFFADWFRDLDEPNDAPESLLRLRCMAYL